MPEKFELRWKSGSLSLHRCRVVGILNLTPDSFYDGGKYTQLEKAIERAWEMVDEGADVLDVGAESSRPGSLSISAEDEKKRILPVLERLKEESYPLPISLDTTKAQILSQACKNDLVQIANDISGLRDPAMVATVIANDIPVIIMHMMGTPQTMQKEYVYEDVVTDIISFFKKRLNDCRLKNNVVLDPGIGFGKSVAHNLAILNRLHEICGLGFPVMVGASRKSFIGEVLDVPVDQRLEGSLAAAAISVYHGAKMLRVHDVRETVRLVKLVESIASKSP